ncbi:MAG TPA: glycosyltransferase 87 family protein [Chloroflexia bacterium]|nr:glycosyltransferase 87 family protein [Chloroflexia bacterium]
MNKTRRIALATGIRNVLKLHWLTFVVVGALFALFLLLITTTNQIYHSIGELGSLDGMRGFSGVEHLKDYKGQDFPYSWTTAQAAITFRNLPRYAPIELDLDMSLERPANFPPAKVDILLGDDPATALRLNTFQFDPQKPGFQRYTISIPQGSPPGEPGFTVQINSNGFKPGDGRELGVRVNGFGVKALTGWSKVFVWPNPYVPAVLLFTLGLLLWAVRLRLAWLETGLLATPLLITAAESAQYMQARSWWLIFCALVFGLAALLYQPSSANAQSKRRDNVGVIGPILLAVLAVTGFFVTSWPAVYDARYYIDWNSAISQYGPFGIYAHAESLNYPPVIVYLLWLYGLVANPLGLGSSYTAVKFFLSLSLPALVFVVWWFYRRDKESKVSANLPAILLMLGISAGAIYNPVVYGQSDAPLGLLLVWSFLLISRKRPIPGALMLTLSLLYKIQTVYVAPLLLILMLKKSGWRKTALAALPALALLLVLAVPAFGFSWNEFSAYWNQGQLAGDGLLEYGAFNLLDLLNANNGTVSWVVPFGFTVIAVVYLGLAASLWFGQADERDSSFASGLAILVCFMFAVKVKQHYLYYPLPFLGLAALFDRRVMKPWLLLGGVYTLMLIVSPVLSRRGSVFDNFLSWNRLLQDWQPWFQDLLALSGLLIFCYLLSFYAWRWWRKPGRPISSEKEIAPAGESLTRL